MTEVTVQKKGDGIAIYADNIQNNIQQAKKILGKSRSPAKHLHGKKRKRYESKRFRRLYTVPRLAVGE